MVASINIINRSTPKGVEVVLRGCDREVFIITMVAHYLVLQLLIKLCFRCTTSVSWFHYVNSFPDIARARTIYSHIIYDTSPEVI